MRRFDETGFIYGESESDGEVDKKVAELKKQMRRGQRESDQQPRYLREYQKTESQKALKEFPMQKIPHK